MSPSTTAASSASSLPLNPFDNILNFRDAGVSINRFAGKRLVREGLLFRSARPDDATLDDRAKLRHDFGIRTVMDLRTKTEHLNQAKKREADNKLPALVKSNAALAEPVQIPRLKYLEIRLTGRRFEHFLLSQLSWASFFKLIFLFVFGYRMQAIAILGREVMRPLGLTGLALATVDQSGPEIAEALHALLEPSGLPVLVHCTQGKDRTGIVIAMALMILGVPLDAIEYDYSLTDEALVSEKETRLREIREIGLTDDFGVTARGLNKKIGEHLESNYGGVNPYLDGIGFDEQDRKRLCELLLY